jgi:hypothetical protein
MKQQNDEALIFLINYNDDTGYGEKIVVAKGTKLSLCTLS